MTSATSSPAWPNCGFQTFSLAVGMVTPLIGLCGLLLVARRLAGALTQQLPVHLLLLTATSAVATVIAARLVGSRNPGIRRNQLLAALLGWGGSLALLLLAIGCSFPGPRLLDWLVWVPLLVLEQFSRHGFAENRRREKLRLAPPTVAKRERDQEPVLTDRLQEIFRVREPDGTEAIYASLRAEFQPGQRHATVFLGFCPPLGHVPAIEAVTCEGPPAELKVVQVLPHGARIDVRLASNPQESTIVVIDLAARHPECQEAQRSDARR
jgi:hypothetical protein